MKARSTLPSLAAGLITALALGLFLHTAISRQSAARSRRVSSAIAAENSGPASGSSRLQPRPVMSAAEHATDVEKKVRAALSLGSPLDRTRALVTLMKDFSSDDFRVALRSSPQAHQYLTVEDLDPLFEEWARRDPLAAINDPASSRIMRSRALTIWAQNDPQGALDYAMKEKAVSDPRGHLLSRVLGTIAETNPDLVMQQIGRLGPDSLVGPLASINSRASPGTRAVILSWLDSLQNPAQQRAVASEIFASWGNENAQQEKFALLKRFPTAAAGDSIDNFVEQWMEFDPTAAQDALDRLPEDPDRPAIFGYLLSRLVDRDDGAALSSLMERFPDEVTDARIAAEIAGSTKREPPQSIAKLPLIRDPALRDQTLAKILTDWTATDPEAASQWTAAHSQ